MKLIPNKWLNRIAGLGLVMLAGRKQKSSPEQLRKMEFGTDTGKMGVRFSERLRNAWRSKWIKLKR